jgi:TRAP-type C4-dicarboxylate transport system substrate-binding protein
VELLDFIDRINERAKGELRFEYKGGPETIPQAQQPLAVRNGVVGMANVSAAMCAALVPEANIVTISRVSHNQERQGGFYDEYRKLFANAGLYFLGRSDPKNTAHFYIGFVKKVESPHDLKGLKFFASSTWVKATAEALGMSFSTTPIGDSYTALSTKVFDGWGAPPSSMVLYSMYEVLPYIVEHGFFYTNLIMVMNLDMWKGLPAHLQKLIQDVYDELEPERARSCQAELDGYLKQLKEKTTFITWSPDDVKWFMDTAYKAEADSLIKNSPVNVPALLKLLGH